MKRIGIVIATTAVLFISACSSESASDAQQESQDSSSQATVETEESPESASVEDPEPDPTPEVITYMDVISGPITNAEICTSYTELIDRYTAVVDKRTKSLEGKDDDPYKAAKFVGNNGWVYEELSVGFDDDWVAASTQALNSVSNGQAGTVESLDDYQQASLEACGLDADYSALASSVSSIDREQSSVLSAAESKPWYPKNFSPYGPDLAVKWVDASADCFTRCWYWTLDVISRDGCPSGIYGELSIEKNGVAINWTNDTLALLQPGQKGRLQFITYDDRSYGGTGSLAELNCY